MSSKDLENKVQLVNRFKNLSTAQRKLLVREAKRMLAAMTPLKAQPRESMVFVTVDE